MNTTLPSPPKDYSVKDQAQLRLALENVMRFLFESTNTLTSKGFTGEIHAAVTDAVADLTVTVAASHVDYPIQVRVYEDAPSGSPLVDVAVTEDATLTKLSTSCSALGSRDLPQRELRKWWLQLTNAAGIVQWNGPTSADRDSLPFAAVSAKDNVLAIEYDDDVDVIRVIVPSAQTKTWSGLSGGGTKTYTVGDALDTAPPEAALALDEIRATYLVEVQGGGDWRTMYRGPLRGKKASNVVAKLTAAVTNAIADLTLIISGTAMSFPIAWSVYEDDPTGSPLVSGTASTGTTYTSASGGCSALGSRALPPKEMRKWWVKTVDAQGAEIVWGPTSADRDALPDGAVTRLGQALKCDYDDDTDQVRVTVPSAQTKTFTGLSGGGTVTYTVTDSLDSGSPEVALTDDEVRSTYVVEFHGGGSWKTMYRGSLYGANKDFTVPTLDVQVATSSTKHTFTYMTNAGTIDRRLDNGSWSSAPSSPFDVTRTSSDQVMQLRATASNGQIKTLTFVIPATVTSTQVVVGYVTGSANSGTDDITVSWTSTGTIDHFRVRWMWTGGDYDGVVTDMGSQTSPFVHHKAGTGGHGYDIKTSGGPHDIQYEVIAEDVSNNKLASSTGTVRFFTLA